MLPLYQLNRSDTLNAGKIQEFVMFISRLFLRYPREAFCPLIYVYNISMDATKQDERVISLSERLITDDSTYLMRVLLKSLQLQPILIEFPDPVKKVKDEKSNQNYTKQLYTAVDERPVQLQRF